MIQSRFNVDNPIAKNIINEPGVYDIKVISAYEHISKMNRRCVALFIEDIKSEKVATLFLTISTPKGKSRDSEKKLLQTFMILADTAELEPVESEIFYYDFKNQGLAVKWSKSVYPQLANKKFTIELGTKRIYKDYLIYIDYKVHNVYHYITKQSLEEYVNNLTSVEFTQRDKNGKDYHSFRQR